MVRKTSKFTIDEYNRLYKITRGTGTERHHLLEQRFAKMFGVNNNRTLCVQLTKEQHAYFTSVFRNAVKYGTEYKWSFSMVKLLTSAFWKVFKYDRSLFYATILSMLT